MHSLLAYEQILLGKNRYCCEYCEVLNIHNYHVILPALSFEENYNLNYLEFMLVNLETVQRRSGGGSFKYTLV